MDIRFTCHSVMLTGRYCEMSVIAGGWMGRAIHGPHVVSRAVWVIVETFERDRCRLRQIHRAVRSRTVGSINRPHSHGWTLWTQPQCNHVIHSALNKYGTQLQHAPLG